MEHYQFSYELIDSIDQLSVDDAGLLRKAQAATQLAYAPYSGFNVAAVALLTNGAVALGTNQENASYPVGICAERVLLGNVAMQYPGEKIVAIAISYRSAKRTSDQPISPCGMCRQALLEFEHRSDAPIRLILGGETGQVMIIDSARLLLPFAFTPRELGGQ
ncbi:MAG: cytidine deaminase [Sphingomonadales bacterium]